MSTVIPHDPDTHLDAYGVCTCDCASCCGEAPGKWYDSCRCPSCNCGNLKRRWGIDPEQAS